MRDTLTELKKKEKEELHRQDMQYLTAAEKGLIQTWEALSAYFLRHPLAENEVSNLSLIQHHVEEAIKRWDQGVR